MEGGIPQIFPIECLDEGDASEHTTAENVDRRTLIRQRRALRRPGSATNVRAKRTPPP